MKWAQAMGRRRTKLLVCSVMLAAILALLATWWPHRGDAVIGIWVVDSDASGFRVGVHNSMTVTVLKDRSYLWLFGMARGTWTPEPGGIRLQPDKVDAVEEQAETGSFTPAGRAAPHHMLYDKSADTLTWVPRWLNKVDPTRVVFRRLPAGGK